MKMERLIGILSILLQREKVTAPELAEQFEVSRRTIQRDIESLCRAGIPISTAQGAGGGISIMEGYRVDRTVLTAPEMQAILAGLRSLDSVSGTRRYAQLMEKLSAGTGGLVPGGAHMLIDLSSWYKTSLPPKIELIQSAIEQHRAIRFTYFSPKGESKRTVEPLEPERIFPAKYQVTVLFDPSCRWRLVEEYGADRFTEEPDGRLRFTGGFPDADSVLSWVLTFGDKAELLEPEELRERLGKLTKTLAHRYRRN